MWYNELNMTTKYVQSKRAILQGSINDSTTTCTVTGFLDLSGNPIVQADIGETGYGTFEPNTDREEAVSFTIDSNVAGVAVLTLTRGLLGKAPYGAGGTSFAHNSGTEFVMSNNPSLFNKMTAKDNDEVVTGSWEFPAPTADQSPATKLYVDEIVNGGTVSVNRTVVAATAGATIALGELVYFDKTDAEWKKTAGATPATLWGTLVGIAQGAGVDGGGIAGGVLISGVDTTQTGMTVGATYYASDTAGGISTTAGTFKKAIGVAKSATELYFQGNADWTEKIVTEEVSSATPTINSDVSKVHRLTAQAVDITSMTTNLTGNPDLWELLVIEITATAAGDRNITWGASFSDGDVYTLPETITLSTTLKVFFNWNGATWSVIGYA